MAWETRLVHEGAPYLQNTVSSPLKVQKLRVLLLRRVLFYKGCSLMSCAAQSVSAFSLANFMCTKEF